jgi:hypothetical protein
MIILFASGVFWRNGQGSFLLLMIFKIVVHLIAGRVCCFNGWHKLFDIWEQRHHIGFNWLFVWWCSGFIRFRIFILQHLPNLSVSNKLLSLDPICLIRPWNLRNTLNRSSTRGSSDKEPMFSCSKAWPKSIVANRNWYRTRYLVRNPATWTCVIPCIWSSWDQIGMDLRGTYALWGLHSTLKLSAGPELVHELGHCVIACLIVESGLWGSR